MNVVAVPTCKRKGKQAFQRRGGRARERAHREREKAGEAAGAGWGPCHVAAGGVDHPLGLARGPAGVEHEEGVLGVCGEAGERGSLSALCCGPEERGGELVGEARLGCAPTHSTSACFAWKLTASLHHWSRSGTQGTFSLGPPCGLSMHTTCFTSIPSRLASFSASSTMLFSGMGLAPRFTADMVKMALGRESSMRWWSASAEKPGGRGGD